VKFLSIAKRELLSFAVTPIVWVVATLFLLVEGYSFWLYVELLNGRRTPHGAVLQYFFGGTFLYWLFLLFIAAVLTMRLLAEERRQGTLEPLLTAPVDEWEVIVGKYAGALALWALLWAPTLFFVIVLRAYAPPGSPLDWGPIAAGYLGTMLVGASALAVGTLASSLTRNQIVAATVGFVALAMLLLVGALGDALVRGGAASPIFRHMNLFRHMEDFGRGIVDTRHVVYHLSIAALCLFAATRALGATKGR
jgi:ABC-2 type transport system permease protein